MSGGDVGEIMSLIVGLGFVIWIFAGARTTAKARAQQALRRRGICPMHFKPFTDQRRDPEHSGWYSSLCEDCIPEYKEQERKRLEYLMKAAR